MTETTTSSQKLDLNTVLASVVKNGSFPFACWQMPGEDAVSLLVSFKKAVKLESPLADTDPGFVVNSFSDNHSIKPLLIPADLLISSDGSYRKGKHVSEYEVDAFMDSIRATKSSPAQVKPSATTMVKNHEDRHNFQSMVGRAVDLIRHSTLDKVVLSRFEDLELNPSYDLSALFRRLSQAYTNAFCNIWSLADGKIWIGASPETLISQEGPIFRTSSLAGTQPLLNQSIQDISWRQKEIEEQALVSRYIINCFKKLRIREFSEHGPKTIAAGSLAHLITTYAVNVDEIRFEELADQMAELLHPTSAVCGMPMQEALSFIQQNETYDREFYAGFIGPVNIAARSHLFVNLRCMKIEKNLARIYAGAGITEDSNAQQEYEETLMKMEIIKSKLRL